MSENKVVKEKETVVNKEYLESEYGILRRHVRQIQNFGKNFKYMVMLRPINKDIADKLKDGYREKIISVKGKSSEFRFLAGDVPYNAGLSKLGKDGKDSDWGKIEHFNALNEKSLKDNDEVNIIKKQAEEIKNKIVNFKKEIQNQEKILKDAKQLIENANNINKDKLEENKHNFEKLSASLDESRTKYNEAREEFKNKAQKYNLSFNLSKITKVVKIDDKEYESFYKIGKDGHPVYEEINNGSNTEQQLVIYVRELGDNGKYLKIKYDDNGGYPIDNNSETQIKADSKELKPIEIFSCEQYERCASNDNRKIRISNTTEMEFKVEKYYNKDNEFFVKLDGEEGYHKLINGRVLAGQRKEGEYEVYTYEVDSALTEINAEELEELEENYELINPPLTADYDQLSVAQVYSGEKIDSIYNMDSAVNYVKEEQKKLISNPPDEYLRSLKDAAKRLYENSYNQDVEKRNKDFDLVKEFLPEGLSANDETLPEKCSVL